MNHLRSGSSWLAAALAVGVCSAFAAVDERPLVRLRGADFAGGANNRFGTVQHGRSKVNYVYAASTAPLDKMRATFTLKRLPGASKILAIYGMDDDAPAACPIEIALNGKTVFTGPSTFPNEAWAWKRLPIPNGTLKAGDNVLTIANQAGQGTAGMPPWFMVALCYVGPKDMDVSVRPSIEEEFFVTLPDRRRPLPEPLPAGQAEPSFKFRGTKGWMWTPDQYLAEIPTLAKVKMNFLMNCYGSMCDIEHHRWGSPDCNRWWEPLPPEKRQAYEKVVRACQAHKIHYCFSMNPNLTSRRILDYAKADDLDALWQHYDWMQGLGVEWFSICLDDIHKGIDAKGQARVVNAIFSRLRAKDADAQMVFCPTFYWGTGTKPAAKRYLTTLARELHKDVYVFWTGPGVVTPTIPRSAAEAYKACVGHRLFVWDNYPVNDAHPTLHLGPVTGRDPDLGDVVDGYMANPLCQQNEINRIPLMTLADYAYNAAAYDPARSIGQAIVHLADTPNQQRALKDLVELYPGMLLSRKGTNWNPVLARFRAIIDEPHSRYVARLYLNHVAGVSKHLAGAFPDQFRAARKTVDADVGKMQTTFREKYGP